MDDENNWELIADGVKMKTLSDGKKLFKTPSGTLRTTLSDGETVIMEKHTSGLVIEIKENGTIVQTNPDGTTITKMPKNLGGVQIDHNPKTQVTITHAAGVVTHEDKALGYKIMKFPDGYSIYGMFFFK